LRARVLPEASRSGSRCAAQPTGISGSFRPRTINRPNVVFPCGPDLTACRTEVAEGRHRILANTWRPVPLEGSDPFGIRARSTPGHDTLVIVVTAENELSTALGHLLCTETRSTEISCNGGLPVVESRHRLPVMYENSIDKNLG
jgi:hypothetical protein